MITKRDIICVAVILVRSILLTRTTDAQNEVEHSYHIVRGLYFLVDIFVATIYLFICLKSLC